MCTVVIAVLTQGRTTTKQTTADFILKGHSTGWEDLFLAWSPAGPLQSYSDEFRIVTAQVGVVG